MCPMLQVQTPEYVTMGGEDTSVYIYDISMQHHKGAKVVNKLQVGPFFGHQDLVRVLRNPI